MIFDNSDGTVSRKLPEEAKLALQKWDEVESRRALLRVRNNSVDEAVQEFVNRILVGESVWEATEKVGWKQNVRSV